MNPYRASLELLFASALWGFGFIATRWGMTSFPPLWLNVIRFLIALAVGLPIALLIPSACRELLPQFRYALVPGVALALAVGVQTIGLKTTTISKAAFITTLYVVMVPMMRAVWKKKWPSPLHLCCVVLALYGTFLMCEIRDFHFETGDLWVFACAVFSTIQIFWLEKISFRITSSHAFNCMQSLWGLLSLSLIAVGTETFPHEVSSTSLWGVGVLAIASTTLAFFLQVKNQKILSSSTASLIFLMESPFAAAYSFLIFGETLTLTQFVGSLFILLASALAIRQSEPVAIPLKD